MEKCSNQTEVPVMLLVALVSICAACFAASVCGVTSAEYCLCAQHEGACGREVTAPLNPILSTRWRRVVSFMH